MQCGLPPTLEDTSYPEMGKAKRRVQRRNANKGAKAQNKAGSPQAAGEPVRAGTQDTVEYLFNITDALTHVVAPLKPWSSPRMARW